MCLPAGHAMLDMAPRVLEHLAPAHVNYFAHWCTLLHLEMSANEQRKKGPKELWCRTGWQR